MPKYQLFSNTAAVLAFSWCFYPEQRYTIFITVKIALEQLRVLLKGSKHLMNGSLLDSNLHPSGCHSRYKNSSWKMTKEHTILVKVVHMVSNAIFQHLLKPFAWVKVMTLKPETHQTDANALTLMKADHVVASCCQRWGKKASLEHIERTTSDCQAACMFCVCV